MGGDPWHRWLTHPPAYRNLVIARMNLIMVRAEIDKPKTAAAYRDAISLLAYAGQVMPTQDYLEALRGVEHDGRCVECQAEGDGTCAACHKLLCHEHAHINAAGVAVCEFCLGVDSPGSAK